MSDPIERAARLIASADGLLVMAGAGMGVDSGLPDFRSQDGFWRAYPALGHSSILFQQVASPGMFRSNPRRAWGFYGHRLALYRRTEPHAGFAILKEFGARMAQGLFVVTSNVDGQFQKAGFDPKHILEIHGSIHYLQCLNACQEKVWPADDLKPVTDDLACEWLSKLPTCPDCQCVARPNLLMFNDGYWLPNRNILQRANWSAWLDSARTPVIIECGAGLGIPTIRHMSEKQGCQVIRINPTDPGLPESAGVSLRMGAKAALTLISVALQKQ